METNITNQRTILVADTKTQRRYQINTSATTLGELQDALTAQGIDYTGMSFTEGITKTQLLGRDSLLPTNVMYKGQPTNNLVILLTNTTKNISSGAISRKEAYRLVKELELQNAILEGEGKNYTQVKTDNLEEYIYIAQKAAGINTEEEPAECPEVQPQESSALPNIKRAPHADTVEWFYMGLKALVKDNMLYADDIAVIADLTTELYSRLKESEPKISDADIDDMIASL